MVFVLLSSAVWVLVFAAGFVVVGLGKLFGIKLSAVGMVGLFRGRAELVWSDFVLATLWLICPCCWACSKMALSPMHDDIFGFIWDVCFFDVW